MHNAYMEWNFACFRGIMDTYRGNSEWFGWSSDRRGVVYSNFWLHALLHGMKLWQSMEDPNMDRWVTATSRPSWEGQGGGMERVNSWNTQPTQIHWKWMFLSKARCHCPVKAWNMSIYYEKLMVLMPGRIGRISAFKLLGIDGIDAQSNLCRSN